MSIENRIKAFAQLGKLIKGLSDTEFEAISNSIQNNNNWFTPEQTRFAFNALAAVLEEGSLIAWLGKYDLESNPQQKDIGILMAGNVPAVGFHDLMSVLIAGHRASVKLSSTDKVAMQWLIDKLVEIEPGFKSRVSVEDMLKGKDAYIATGSDNSARYFDYYFGKYPHIIRKNRTSVGVLNGEETADDFQNLGKDIFQYFGLGCRNVSKIFIPHEELLEPFLNGIQSYHLSTSHHKYLNNYDYNKSIFLVNKDVHLDNGFLLVKESKDLVSPIAVLYYETYKGLDDLNLKLREIAEKTQCKVSRQAWLPESLSFGQAQCPSLDDYADGVDTIAFLKQLK